MNKKVLIVNGVERTLIVDQEALLSDVLRKQLHLTGVKVGCGTGQCGACNVILDGKLVRSCVIKMKRVEHRARITTIEGIGTPLNLHPIQKAFIFHHAIQCGFCTPGFIVSTKALLDQNLNPTREDVRDWFQKYRNACRCTGYSMIVDAVMDAAKVSARRDHRPGPGIQDPGRRQGIRNPYPPPHTLLPRFPACGISARTWVPSSPKGPCSAHWYSPRFPTPSSRASTPPKPRRCPASSRSLPTRTSKDSNRITGLITFPTNKGDGWDRPILNDEKIFQYGDVVAIVCADTRENAKAAAKRSRLTWKCCRLHERPGRHGR